MSESLVRDTFGRATADLRISVTDRCNFRCTYCMPSETYAGKYYFLPRKELLSFEEITRLARVFLGLGVRKIRLTGGEPLIRNEIEGLVAQLAALSPGLDLTLTTNGYLLAQKAQALKEAGLGRVTVSLDALDDAVFGRMNGRGFTTQRVLEGIWKAVEVGLTPVKVNAVVQRGVNDHTIVDLARYFKGTGVTVRFIEYMDVGSRNGWRMDQVVPAEEIVRRIDAELPLDPVERNYESEVALRYRYVDGGGEVGVIASVTKPFCGDCTRVRLSPDGKVYTCLFASLGHDLKGLLRSGATDTDLEEKLRRIWSARTDRYSEERTSETAHRAGRVEMYQIGG
ncbi:MAG: GTP 3',8-cyclase MoaA [Chloroflexi bacterium]|nr:GTP 3',8-cyclase MoaA [Chloroflexota bacterium]